MAQGLWVVTLGLLGERGVGRTCLGFMVKAGNDVNALIVRLLGIGGPRGWRSCRCVIIRELSLVCLTPVTAAGRRSGCPGSDALGGPIATKGVRCVVVSRRGGHSSCPLGRLVIAGRGERNLAASWRQ